MAQRKMYSAFISSVYESLRDERGAVIDSLLDFNVFPVCMEHFTASLSGKFKDIEQRIDESDFVILILGAVYGSRDENGISWTEREYNYASAQSKPMVALFCDELNALRRRRGCDDLTEDERAQLAFSDKITFARSVTEDMPISKIMTQFFSGYDFSKCVGWSRNCVLSRTELEEWRAAHRCLSLEGTWYHAHLSADDDKYIRTGVIKITQRFDHENYGKLSFDGLNYNIRYDAATGEISEKMLMRTHWRGDYDMDENGVMFGIFTAKREFSGKFNEQTVNKGTRRGIHDFTVPTDVEGATQSFQGEFHDEAPSPKIGVIYVFRNREDRDEYLRQNFAEVLENNK